MDAVIVNGGDLTVACSIFPCGIFGWGKDEKSAISQLSDNLYNFCNWTQKPLPKDTAIKILGRYYGDIESLSFKEDGGINVKKLAEVAWQTAFSFKCFLDSFLSSDEQEEIFKDVYKPLSIADGEGIMGFASNIIDSGNLPKIRAFIFFTYKKAKEIYKIASDGGKTFTDTFKFQFA